MPIKPKPFVYMCTACGWRKAVALKSDALGAGEYHDCCPTCGATSLKKETHNSLVEQGIIIVGK